MDHKYFVIELRRYKENLQGRQVETEGGKVQAKRFQKAMG